MNANINSEYLPWFTTDSIDFITKNINEEDTVIEFGGGMSSIWWANRCKFTQTVEASHSWASKIILEMCKYPSVLSKWSLKFVPCDWNPTSDQPKSYWSKNSNVLTSEIIDNLNNRYLSIDFDPTIIVIDGSIRPLNIERVDEYVSKNNSVRMIIVDNMETLGSYTEKKFKNFTKFEFPEKELSKIPDHQNGKWNTSVWIKNI